MVASLDQQVAERGMRTTVGGIKLDDPAVEPDGGRNVAPAGVEFGRSGLDGRAVGRRLPLRDHYHG